MTTLKACASPHQSPVAHLCLGMRLSLYVHMRTPAPWHLYYVYGVLSVRQSFFLCVSLCGDRSQLRNRFNIPIFISAITAHMFRVLGGSPSLAQVTSFVETYFLTTACVMHAVGHRTCCICSKFLQMHDACPTDQPVSIANGRKMLSLCILAACCLIRCQKDQLVFLKMA